MLYFCNTDYSFKQIIQLITVLQFRQFYSCRQSYLLYCQVTESWGVPTMRVVESGGMAAVTQVAVSKGVAAMQGGELGSAED